MLTGGDLITAEHKFQRSFQFVNGTKLIFSCNILPESKDDSDAFFKRWIIVPFNRTIPPEQQDRDLLAKLTTPQELSGFLNKALATYKEMEVRGSFTGEDDIEGKRAFYQRLSDPISCFIDDCVDFDPDKYTVKQQLFQAFQTYCKEKRYGKVYTQKRFFRDFRDKAGSNYIVDSQINLDTGGTTRILRGVNLREAIAPLAPLAAFFHLTNMQNPMETKRKNPAKPAKPATSQTTISQPKEGPPQ
jgi:phage/plasmid-associated DNA primase